MADPYPSLRDYLDTLEKRGDLARVAVPVDPRWEVAGISQRLHAQRGPAVLYENPRGHPGWRLVDHVLGTFDRAFEVLGTTRERAFDDYIARSPHLVSPRVVDDAAWTDVVQRGGDVDVTAMPVPTWGEFDGGPYITCGVVMARDPETGFQNMAIYRIQVKGPRTCGIFVHMPQHIGYIHAKYAERHQPMPIAVAIGVDPLVHLCCEAPLPYGVSEMDLYGALAGTPLAAHPCETNGLLVPATAEVVLEGEVTTDAREPEGPFGEFAGYYSGVYNAPVFHVRQMSHRRQPIYQGMMEGKPPTEGHIVEGLPQALECVKQLRAFLPQVKAMRALGPTCLQCVVSIDRSLKYPGIAKRVGNAVWTSTAGQYFKNILVVDDDVDIFSDADVWWALATRFQADTDLTLIPDTMGVLLDPSEKRRLRAGAKEAWDGLTCRAIFDCTIPLPPFDEAYRRGVVDVPEPIKAQVKVRWTEYGLP